MSDLGRQAQSDLAKLGDARQRRIATIKRAGEEMKAVLNDLPDDAGGAETAKAMVDQVVALVIVAVSGD